MSAMMQNEAKRLAALCEDEGVSAAPVVRAPRHLSLAPRPVSSSVGPAPMSDRFLALSPNPIYQINLQTRRYASVSDLPIDGSAPREMGLAELVERYVHPDDQMSILTSYDDIQSCGVREMEFRSRCGAEYRWMLAREVVSSVDEEGRPVELFGVVTDIHALVEARQRLAALAVTDELTQLPNRRAFRQRLEQLVCESARGRHFSLVILDVDHFKKINDTFGHDVGDKVLVAVADVLLGRLRRTDFVARIGGEEFALLLSDLSHEDALRVAEDLRARIAQMMVPCRVTASFGLCSHEESREASPERLFRAADAALYYAKNQGRNRVVSA
jgi:diguanylate cyclase (GGDEF)-like protein